MYFISWLLLQFHSLFNSIVQCLQQSLANRFPKFTRRHRVQSNDVIWMMWHLETLESARDTKFGNLLIVRSRSFEIDFCAYKQFYTLLYVTKKSLKFRRNIYIHSSTVSVNGVEFFNIKTFSKHRYVSLPLLSILSGKVLLCGFSSRRILSFDMSDV